MANLTGMKVVGVYYRLAPEHPYPAAVDDVIAVYRELLKTNKPSAIGIYGTSAGAGLTAEVALRLKQLKLPQPAALGMFSVPVDMSRPTDSRQIFTLNGFSGQSEAKDPNKPEDLAYAGKTDPRDPVLSPIYADVSRLAPTLLVTSTRDILLSDASRMHLQMLRAGDDAELLVFDALPHAFWYHFDLPETKQALEMMAQFFVKRVGR